jgi:hypothetical protein
MSRSSAVRKSSADPPVPQPELVPPTAADDHLLDDDFVDTTLPEEDRAVVQNWVESLRASAADVHATREAWEALITVFAALIVGVALCYFLVHFS